MKALYLAVILVVCLLSFDTSRAQEIDFTQYYLNLPGINPGFTGMEDYIDLKMAYRQGWNGFGVKNNNVFVSAYGALGSSSKNYSRKNAMRISNQEAFDQLQSGQSARRRQGIGGMVTNRTVGPYQSLSVSGNYAYHLPVSDKLNVSLGTRVAYGSQRVDFNGYTVRDEVTDQFYQHLIQSNPGNQNSVSVDFGSVVYSSRFYLAFSSTNLGLKSLNGDPSLSVSNKRQFSLQSAVDLPISSELSLNTGAKLTHADGYDLMWGVNSRLRYKEIVYVGAGYNSASRMSFLLGLAIDRSFTLNYAYDHYFAGIGALNVNVHEVVLGLAVLNKFDAKSRLW